MRITKHDWAEILMAGIYLTLTVFLISPSGMEWFFSIFSKEFLIVWLMTTLFLGSMYFASKSERGSDPGTILLVHILPFWITFCLAAVVWLGVTFLVKLIF